MYMSVKQAAEKWGISDRRVRTLCAEGKVPGVIREGRSYRIPAGAKKPEDGRYRSAASLLEMINRKKAELDTRRPLTEGEAERLTEEFVVEYTYNSNAIEGNTLTLRETDLAVRAEAYCREIEGDALSFVENSGSVFIFISPDK